MPTGKVKFYSSKKGFGFIEVAGSAKEEQFFHISAVTDDEWMPAPGDRVTFEEGINPKDNRPRAEKVAPA